VDDAAERLDQLRLLCADPISDPMEPRVMAWSLKQRPERRFVGASASCSARRKPHDAAGANYIIEAKAAPARDPVAQTHMPATPTDFVQRLVCAARACEAGAIATHPVLLIVGRDASAT